MISWTTPGGTAVSLAIRTEETWTDDGLTFARRCYTLEILVGNAVWGGADLIEHPQHGTVLSAYTGGEMVKVPSEHRAAIAALLDEYRAEVDRRLDRARLIDRQHEAHRAVMRKVLGSACVDE